MNPTKQLEHFVLSPWLGAFAGPQFVLLNAGNEWAANTQWFVGVRVSETTVPGEPLERLSEVQPS